MRMAVQNFGPDRGQSLSEDFADVRMAPGSPHNPGDRVTIDVADGKLIQVRGEAAAWFHLSARRNDEGLPGPSQ